MVYSQILLFGICLSATKRIHSEWGQELQIYPYRVSWCQEGKTIYFLLLNPFTERNSLPINKRYFINYLPTLMSFQIPFSFFCGNNTFLLMKVNEIWAVEGF